MDITINYKKPREVKNPCLRCEDIKSPKQLMEEMLKINCDENNSSNKTNILFDRRIVELARQIINTNERNRIAKLNEDDIATIKTTILISTTKSDLISYDSCTKILSETCLIRLQKRAITMALRDLCEEGHLKEKRISVEKENSYNVMVRKVVTVYERI